MSALSNLAAAFALAAGICFGVGAAKADLQKRTARTPYVCPMPDSVAPPLDMSLG